TSAPARLYDTDSMEQVMRTFDDTKAWNLPVVDAEKGRKNRSPFLERRMSNRPALVLKIGRKCKYFKE
ncbi:hypothetical protein QM006_00055, partial [Bacteroides uniformis]|uniref:hypothetical protein n=1 Tax=Bacteroides uniformis TaxID=820 RepID=UPI00406C0247